jgi:hypothetical protein
MNKLSYLLLLSSLLFLSACGGTTDSNQAENTTPAPKPEPEVNNEVINEDLTADSDASLSTVSGLIPSTNPDQRLKQIEQGKNNPFSSINPPAVVKVPTTNNIPSDDSSFKDKAIAKVEPPSTPSTPSSATNKGQVAPSPTNGGSSNVIDMESQLESAPTIRVPTPTEAEGITVSGILNLQGENVALIQTPWDTTPRSVRVGEIISDATSGVNVRVQEISFTESSSSNVALIGDNQTFFRNLGRPNGIVVLEQYGQLVTKEVGQQVANQEQVEEL